MAGWEPTGHVRRGLRYEVVAPVRYRCAAGGGEWLDASTVNMGHLGLLMKTRNAAPPLTSSLELQIALAAGSAGSVVACTGRVAWVGSLPTGEMMLAVTIDDYRFQKAQLISCSCEPFPRATPNELPGEPDMSEAEADPRALPPPRHE